MRFTITTLKPGNQPPQSSFEFSAPGGTIGRGTDNNLVLPDSDRAISRLQAIVHISADGECRITNRGNVTRVLLNDIPLERGRQVELQDGDVIGIDEYRLTVSDPRQGVPQSEPLQPVAVQPPQPGPQSQDALTENAHAEHAPTAVPTEIWDSLMQEFSIADSISSGRRAEPQPQNVPENPFHAPSEPERNPEDPLAHFNSDDDAPLFESKPVATDKLFSEEELFSGDSILKDGTPSTLQQPEAGRQPVPEQDPADGELDPLALFGGSNAKESSSQSTRHDDPLGLLGGTPLTHPDDLAPEPASAAAPEPEAKPTPEETPEPVRDEMPLASLSDSPLFAQEPAAPVPPVAASEEPPPPQEPPAQPEPSYAARDDIPLPEPHAVQHRASVSTSGRLRIDPVSAAPRAGKVGEVTPAGGGDVLQGELLEALLEGMGLSDMQPVPQFDRDNMRQLGQMLSMFSQGTVALLSSRSILKRGVKADMTMILDDANNPFKLLPSGKTVLMQMFGSRMPGFMEPKKSVRDALIDLQAHQLGMISGIRAIIASMLQSFNPEQLEEEAKREGAASRLALPGSRKAALWDYFVRQYGATAGEIEDDFHTLFGEAFLHAYDMEVNQYKDSQSGSEGE
jgi:FHA domain-containing protein